MKQWTKPAPDRQITGVATDLFRSKQDLIAENAFLRQQVIVLKRQHTGRPSITQQDRRVLVVLASKLRGWKDALHIVTAGHGDEVAPARLSVVLEKKIARPNTPTTDIAGDDCLDQRDGD